MEYQPIYPLDAFHISLDLNRPFPCLEVTPAHYLYLWGFVSNMPMGHFLGIKMSNIGDFSRKKRILCFLEGYKGP